MSKNQIVTFTSNNHVHVYSGKTGVKPMPPFKTHGSIEEAKQYLKEKRSIEEPKILEK